MKTASLLPFCSTRRLAAACGILFLASAGVTPAQSPEAPKPAPAVPAADAPSTLLPEALKSALKTGLFEEEANRDFDKAISAYRAALELYDTHRAGAGTVLYRLAECLRKKGQPAEAVPLYRRVLAEFPQETDLCADSRRRLAELAPGEDPAGADTQRPISQEEANTLADLQVLAERNPGMLPQRNNVFLSAAREGRLRVVEFFVRHKVDGLDFSWALNYAAKAGHLAIVRLLVENKTAPLDFATALGDSAAAGNLAVVEFLLKHGADVKKDGAVALIRAMQEKRTALIYKLIDAGADLNAGAQNPTGAPAIKPAPGVPVVRGVPGGKAEPGILRPLAMALDARDGQLARYLVEKGAGCDVASETEASGGKFPLHLAWSPDMVRFLVDHGADLESRDPDGRTPLLAAGPDCEVTEALMAAGADLKATDATDATVIYTLTMGVLGNTAFNDSIILPAPLFSGSQDILEKDDTRIPEIRKQAVRILDAAVKAGVPVNGLIRKFGWAAAGHPRPVTSRAPVLADACALFQTPAQCDFVEQLIQRGAEVNFADELGVTPLHTAASRRIHPLLTLLLKHGANPMAETTARLDKRNRQFPALSAGGPAPGMPRNN